MIEFDVDMGYLLEEGELDCVVLNDENGEHKPMEFRPSGGECKNLIDPWSVHDEFESDFECSECHATGHADGNVTGGEYLFCPRCGARVRKAVER